MGEVRKSEDFPLRTVPIPPHVQSHGEHRTTTHQPKRTAVSSCSTYFDILLSISWQTTSSEAVSSNPSYPKLSRRISRWQPSSRCFRMFCSWWIGSSRRIGLKRCVLIHNVDIVSTVYALTCFVCILCISCSCTYFQEQRVLLAVSMIYLVILYLRGLSILMLLFIYPHQSSTCTTLKWHSSQNMKVHL